MCGFCGGSGYVTIDVPIYGNPYDVDQGEARCRCNPEPTDDDYPDFDVPLVDFDPVFRDSTYEGI